MRIDSPPDVTVRHEHADCMECPSRESCPSRDAETRHVKDIEIHATLTAHVKASRVCPATVKPATARFPRGLRPQSSTAQG